ncbi:hypothetical protein ES706_05847 [subsurface metagenome]
MQSYLSYLLILLATGIGVGFASGALGVGGAFITIPVTYWVIAGMGVSADTAIKIAIGTNLLVILATAISGALGHNKRGAVRWKVALALGLCGSIGALVGAMLAVRLPGESLRVGFGALVLAVALWMALNTALNLTRERGKTKENLPVLCLCGFPIGMITGLTGIGGGIVAVPMLVLAFGFPMHLAVGTSMAMIIFTSLGGVIGYMVNGVGISALPYSVGYVNLPIWLCLAATSVPMAQLGAKVAHALPAKQLSYVFIAIMVCVGLKMLGVVL